MDNRNSTIISERVGALAEQSVLDSPGSLSGTLSELRAFRPARGILWGASLALTVAGLLVLTSAGYWMISALGGFSSVPLSPLPDGRILKQYNQHLIHTVAVDPNSANLLVGTELGLQKYHCRARLWSFLAPPGDGADFPVHWVSESPAGILCGDGRGGIFQIGNGCDLSEIIFGRSGFQGFSLAQVRSLAASPSEVFMAAGRAALLYNRKHRTWRAFSLNPDSCRWKKHLTGQLIAKVTGARINDLIYHPVQKAFYLGTDRGLFLRQGGKWERPRPGADSATDPIKSVQYNQGRIWYVRQGPQQSLRIGHLGTSGEFIDLLKPSRLVADASHFTDATAFGKFTFVSSARNFLRVCNREDHSWEAVSFNEKGTSPAVRSLAIFDGKLWLGTDRGLMLFRSPGKIWAIARQARIPVFETIQPAGWGNLFLSDEEDPEQIQRLVVTERALFIATRTEKLGRIERGTEKIQWLLGRTRAAHSLKGDNPGLKYPLKARDLLCALEAENGLLVGTRRGVLKYRYEDRLWEEFEPATYSGHAVISLHRDPLNGRLFFISSDGLHLFDGRVVPHTSGDAFQRIAASVRGPFYLTRSGKLGIVPRGDSRPATLIDSAPCPVLPRELVTASQDGEKIFFGSRGGTIAVYDTRQRKWGELKPPYVTELPGRNTSRKRLLEVRAGAGLLGCRTADGQLFLRRGRGKWQTLIGPPLEAPLSDKELSDAILDEDRLWVAGRNIIAAYDLTRRRWLKPRMLPTSSRIRTLKLLDRVPVALTAEKQLFLGTHLIAKGVRAFDTTPGQMIFARRNELVAYRDGRQTTLTRAGRFPAGLIFFDIVATQGGWWVATSGGLLCLGSDGIPLTQKEFLPSISFSEFRVGPRQVRETSPLYAISSSARTPVWTLKEETQEWIPTTKAPADCSTINDCRSGNISIRIRAVPGRAFSRVEKSIRSIDGAWHTFQLSRGRWSFDRVFSMAVLDGSLWLATGSGIERVRSALAGSSAGKQPASFVLQTGLCLTDALFFFENTQPYFSTEGPDGRVGLYHYNPELQGWAPQPIRGSARQPRKARVVQTPYWSWFEERTAPGNLASISGTLFCAENRTRPVLFTNRRFGFDRVDSLSVSRDSLWLSTPNGVTESSLERSALPLASTRFFFVGGQQEQFIRTEKAREGHPPGLYLGGKGESAYQFVREQHRWEPLRHPPAFLLDCAGKEVVVPFNGFFRWWRPLDYDPSPASQAPVVHIDSVGSTGRWYELPFTTARLAFDRVRDVTLHEKYLWAATAGGLCRFPARPLNLDARTMKLYPELSQATDVSINRAINELSARLQSSRSSVYSLALPGGQPHSSGENPFADRPRAATATVRFSRHEEYDGSKYKGVSLRLEIRDTRGAWHPQPISEGLLPFEEVRDFAVFQGRLWLATPAGVVSYDMGQGASMDRMNYFPETGPTRRLQTRKVTLETESLFCAGEEGQVPEVFQYYSKPKLGRNWIKAEDPRVFRAKLFEDGAWHWYRTESGYGIFYRGLAGWPRRLLDGRFADEVVYAAAPWKDSLLALTPVGLAVYAKSGGSPRHTLKALLGPEDHSPSLPSLTRPISAVSIENSLAVASAQGIFLLKISGRSEKYRIERTVPLPCASDCLGALQLRVRKGSLVLSVRETGQRQNLYREYRLEGSRFLPLVRGSEMPFVYDDGQQHLVFGRGLTRNLNAANPQSGAKPASPSVTLPFPPVGIVESGQKAWLATERQVYEIHPEAVEGECGRGQ